MVKFSPASSPKTIMIGKVKEYGVLKIKYLIRKEDNELFSVYESQDNGYSARLLPRLNVETNEECYHLTVKGAQEWIQEYEQK